MIWRTGTILHGLLLIWLLSVTLFPPFVYAQNDAPQVSVASVTDTTKPIKKPSGPAPAASVDQPLKEQKRGLLPLLPNIGIGFAALASTGALIFAVLTWLESKQGLERIIQISQNASGALKRLVDQIPVTTMAETRLTKSFGTDLERFTQDIKNQIISTGGSSQSPPPSAYNNLTNLPVDQIKTILLAAMKSRDTNGLSNITRDLTNQLVAVAQSNTSILNTVQNLKRQLEAQPDPQTPPLSSLLTQMLEPGDTLIESARQLQSVFQKIVSGSRDGDYFLTSLAQNIFLPLSVPLADLNLSEAQMNTRIALLGAMERTRQQSAAVLRKDGMEMMVVDVRKTTFDSTRHESTLGTEMRTDRADLNGKVVEVLRHGFVQKSQNGLERVIRKAQVRLYSHVQPKAVPIAPIPVAPLPETVAPLPETVTPLPETVTPLPETVTPLPETVAPLPETVATDPIDQVKPAEVPIEDAHTAQQLFDAYRGTNSAAISLSDWKILADALTTLCAQKMHAPALDEILAMVFPENSPRTIVPEIGETSKPMYESVSPVPGGIVAEVLRIGIELPSNGSPNRPVLPRVRLTTKEESQVPT